jgi:hypothetical protein
MVRRRRNKEEDGGKFAMEGIIHDQIHILILVLLNLRQAVATSEMPYVREMYHAKISIILGYGVASQAVWSRTFRDSVMVPSSGGRNIGHRSTSDSAPRTRRMANSTALM